MASTPKTGGRTGRASATRSKKPTTIDLEAKEKGKESALKDAMTESRDTKPASTGTTSATDKKTAEIADKKTSANTETAKKIPEADNKSDALKKAPEKEAPKVAAAAPTPPPAKSGGGGFASAVMGAAMAVVGLGAVGQVDGAKDIPLIGALYGGGDAASSGSTGGADTAELDALKQQVAELSQQGSSGVGVDLSPLEQKLASFEEKLNALPAGGDAGGANPELSQRLDTLEASVREIADRPVAVEGDGTVNLAPIQNRIDELAGKVDALPSGGAEQSGESITEAIEPLKTSIAELTAKISAIEESVASAASSEDLASVSDQLPQVTSSIETLSETVTGLDEKIAGLTKRTDDLSVIVDDSAQGLAALDEQSEVLTETVASVKASEKVARSVAVTALATAIENDDPLVQPVNSLKALMGETDETERLEELVAQGIPTRKELVSELDSFTNTVKDPGAPGDDASLSDKFWSNAQKLVTFRSTGPRDGNDVFAILSRVRANVDEDNLQGAEAEWQKLPAEVQTQGESWLARLGMRMEAFALQAAISEKLTAEAG